LSNASEVFNKSSDSESNWSEGWDAKPEERLNMTVKERLGFVVDRHELRDKQCSDNMPTLPSWDFVELAEDRRVWITVMAGTMLEQPIEVRIEECRSETGTVEAVIGCEAPFELGSITGQPRGNVLSQVSAGCDALWCQQISRLSQVRALSKRAGRNHRSSGSLTAKHPIDTRPSDPQPRGEDRRAR
jgi:hypothetical protein